MSLKSGVGAALVAALVAVTASPVRAGETAGSPAPAAAPLKDDDFVAQVRTAIANHDIDLFDKHLVDWDGARKRTQRLTLFQIRECFGRPVKSVAVEPLKLDASEPLVPEGYRTTLPVTHLLRIVFNEDHAPQETPACVFMLSRDPTASYRIVLVLPNAPPPK